MSKVTIIVKDGKRRGEVSVSVEFDPPATDAPMTPAQAAAMEMLSSIQGMDEDDDE